MLFLLALLILGIVWVASALIDNDAASMESLYGMFSKNYIICACKSLVLFIRISLTVWEMCFFAERETASFAHSEVRKYAYQQLSNEHIMSCLFFPFIYQNVKKRNCVFYLNFMLELVLVHFQDDEIFHLSLYFSKLMYLFPSLDLWEFYLPYLYSCISLMGGLLLLSKPINAFSYTLKINKSHC